MKLKKLLESLSGYKIYGKIDLNIKEITEDSRKVKNGSLFVAVKGLTVDGHDFIDRAIASGALAIVGERQPRRRWLNQITYIEVGDSRRVLGLIASSWFGNPSQKLKVIGVTGTDGKTTTANLIYWILKQAGKNVGLISTISAKIGNNEYDTGFHVTNPDPIPLQKFLRKMVDYGCEYAVLEVTSHGLDQERIAGMEFDMGVLTNITHEHLDYHKTFNNYLWSKSKLFKIVKKAVLNKDDDWYLSINCVIPHEAVVLDYAIKTKDTDLSAKNIKYLVGGTKFDVTFWGKDFPKETIFSLQTKLVGDYNVYNTLAAVGTALLYEVSPSDIQRAIKSFTGVSGRMEEIKNSKGIRIIIDFAHTPNALENVLNTLRKDVVKDARLIAVFGCAGERDVRKRPMMGEISGRLADISVFTAEDPRSEKADTIINQMVSGTKLSKAREINAVNYDDSNQRSEKHMYLRIPERGEAISYAIQKLAKKGDIVVICGKGHEKSMAYNGVEYPWSDHEAVEVAMRGGVKVIKHPDL